MTTQEYGELFETAVATLQLDNKGRMIGYLVGFCDNGVDFRAYVQNARMIDGEWVDFGVRQRSKSFASQKAAQTWAYATVKERSQKLQ